MCTDLLKTIKFYSDMPTLFFDSAQQLNRLVYFEEINTEEQALERFKTVSTYTRPQKEKMIRAVNTDWIDLTAGLKYESAQRIRPAAYIRKNTTLLNTSFIAASSLKGRSGYQYQA
ncbi:MAG: hypothetical protein BGO48_18425 [Mucilaginibacter sp. 44-25]|nr:MAG: hypothetical protein BGO48_18425 [Mucilaginibacter sp. 44-25]